MIEQITPLRRHMIEGMSLRNTLPATQRVYINAVKSFSAFFGRSPDKLTFEDVRIYQLHLVSRGLKPTTIHPILYALRFFYRTTLSRSGVTEQISPPRRPDPLPAVLAPEEIVRFLTAVSGLKPRTALTTIYAAGLRVAEAVSLTIKDIDSARMVIHVRQGKGGKDRYVMLSEQLLGILRAYWRLERPAEWLFPGLDPERPLTARTLQLACRLAAQTAGLDKKVTVHTLRHCFATHLLERGVDIRVIQDLLGHCHITSTARYARVAINTIRQVQSSLEHLRLAGPPPA